MFRGQILFNVILIVCIGLGGINAAIKYDKMGPVTEQPDMSVYQVVHYISAEKGSDINGDGSRNKPWQTLVFALKQAANADTHNRVALLVAAGTYTCNDLEMIEYVDLYGGYSEKDWTRNITAHRTVLSGKGRNRVLTAANHSRLDGFVIEQGRIAGHGAGILCEDTSPIISNNVFIDNMTLAPENFNHRRIHQEGHRGGAIACLFNAVPVIQNNIFYQNKTEIGMGAAIAVYGWVRIKGGPEREVIDNRMIGGLRANIENNVFMDNVSGVKDTARTRSSNGAAISCAYEARPVIKNNLIMNNMAKGRSDAGGIYAEYFSFPDIISNYILGNGSDDDGGGIYAMRSSHPLIDDNYICGNYTTGGGPGGVRLSKEGRATIINNIISHNPGGGVLSVDSYMQLTGNIINDNQGGYGITIRSEYDYFPASKIDSNTVRGNEKGSLMLEKYVGAAPIITNNNLDKINKEYGPGNYVDPEKYVETMTRVSVNAIKTDKINLISQLNIEPGAPLQQLIPGKVVQIGHYWSIIKNTSRYGIEIWGIVPEEETSEKLVIMSY